MDLQSAVIKRQIQLVELDEWREKAYHSSKFYKECTKCWHDKQIKIKQFKGGIKYSSLTPAYDCLVMVSLEVSGKALT